jgi:hypothetical protein
LNRLEADILNWNAKEYPEYGLENSIPTLQVTERENTGVGLITSFEHKGGLTPQTSSSGGQSCHLIGPLIKSAALSEGAETQITIENDSVDCMAILARGDSSVDDIGSY